MQRSIFAGINKKNFVVGFLLVLMGMASFLYWGNKKQVWFCDEIYTYESANGFEQEWPAAYIDEWMTGEDVESFFAADWDSFSLNEITVRLYNDHVPLYFWLFRVVSCVFFHGSGSIWIGLVINMVFYLCILVLGYRMFLYLTGSPLASGIVIFLSMVTNRLMLEQITMLRMYAMLLLWELLLLLAALRIMRDAGTRKMNPGIFLFLFAVSVMGFLTHYDFWIFYAVTAATFCMWFLLSAFRREKRFWVTGEFRFVVIWVGNFVASLLTTIWLFPYCRWNLNRGKGQLALRSAFDFSPEKLGNILWGYRRLGIAVFGEALPAAVVLAVMIICLAGGGLSFIKGENNKNWQGLF